ncbi:MAG TPA: N-acetylmuramoyl-L-alanine amidase [Dehalococcoidia bacterium]|nr:N-acetylmuramoyl-L-alanine amidase [Dehalococcoidia bacterium]
MVAGRASLWLALAVAFPLIGIACSRGGASSVVATLAAAPATRTSPAAAAAITATPTPTSTPTKRPPTVVIDPGHGADEIGAAANSIVEKESNLEMALRVERLLSAQGVRVILTRRADVHANSGPPVTGYTATRLDLQARIDLANAEQADLFVSIHSNGSTNAADRGIESYYNSSRPFVAQNQALASALLRNVIAELRAGGFDVRERGALDDACLRAFQGRCFPLFVLGPGRETTRDEAIRRGGDPAALGFAPGQDSITSRATQMPGALIELLFITNPLDAAILQTDAAREAMERGIVRGIMERLPEVAR